ncbi:MAG: type II secretion system protein [Candidatus Staskawiczbacteria bacterium]|nr:type II secretion system protein [Candidatus Staskawiczbacteria bacterium]
MKLIRGFTLVEMLVVIAIIVVLASFVLYNVMQYIDKSKDATLKSNLAVLITAGELWYDRSSSSYVGFCGSTAVAKALSEPPPVSSSDRKCNVNPEGTAWAVCAREFVNSAKAYCVDNKGNQKEIDSSLCTDSITNCIP